MYDDPNKLFSLEQSVSLLYKSISKANNPLPNHNYVKDNGKRVVFDKFERFQESPSKEELPREIRKRKYIGEPKTKHFEPDKLDSFGKGIRFRRNKVYAFPGPGQYKLDDFAESLVKRNDKMNEQSIILRKSENLNSPKREYIMESDDSNSIDNKIWK